MPGKRKLRFDIRKNNERKKRLCKAAACISAIPGDLYVKLPISIYHSGRVRSVSALYERLRKRDILEHGWTCSFASCSSLVILKLSCPNLSLAPNMLFTVIISKDFTWSVRRGDHAIPNNCSSFHGISHELQNVDDVIGFLNLLDQCKFCTGNDDAKFLELAAMRQGKFMDQSGEL